MALKKPDYTFLDHTADMGIKVHGHDLKNLFENAGYALMHLMLRGDISIKRDSREITVLGTDTADLLVRWLGELLYLFEGENLIATNLKVNSIASSRLAANVETVPLDPERHEIIHEIKAVTYHQIEVVESNDRWEARVIFDL